MVVIYSLYTLFTQFPVGGSSHVESGYYNDHD